MCSTEHELSKRHQYIKDITQSSTSPWTEYLCEREICFPTHKYYQCRSDKGEYGIVITAHIEEVQRIIEKSLSNKKALVVVNSCIFKKSYKNRFLDVVKSKNSQSELFFAKQGKDDSGILVNYVDNVGEFGCSTSLSERELFRHRRIGLTKAIRLAYEKVIAE